jgi:type II secretory pathway pseudopilin PulG
MRRQHSGFTLFEVILALSIVIILTATLAEVLSISFKLKRSAENAIAATRDTQAIGDIFVADIANIVTPDPTFTYDGMNATDATATIATGVQTTVPSHLNGPFYGDDAEVYFYTAQNDPKSPLQSGVEYVEYGLTPQDDGTQALVRRVNLNLLSDESLQDPRSTLTEEVILPKVQSVVFSYFDGTNWQDTWDSTTMSPALPFAVKMLVTFDPALPGDEPRTISRSATIVVAQPPPLDTTDTSLTGGQ